MKRKYYWLNASFDEWSFTSLCPGESEGFGVFNLDGNRRFNPKAYASVREGDIALGYQGNPVGKILTIGRITAVPQDISSQSSEIIFTKLVDLQNGVTKDELKNQGLSEIQPITARSGTFFPLTDDEYLSILQIIEEKNPGILDNEFIGAESSLAERIDNIDIHSAVEYAKVSGTYYLGGKLFEYRNYSAGELKRINGKKRLSAIMRSSSDSSMTLIKFKNDSFLVLNCKPNMKLTLKKDYENPYDDEAIAAYRNGGKIGYVANSVSTVCRGTYSAGRIYDRFDKEAECVVRFVSTEYGFLIAEIENDSIKRIISD